MSYNTQFNGEEYNVPGFLFSNEDWDDVSWGNDIAPRWEAERLGIAIWVECIDPARREYEDWKQYTVCRIEKQSDGTFQLAEDAPLFETEDAHKLEEWISYYEVHYYVEGAITALQNMESPNEDLCDELQTAYSVLNTILRFNEVPNNPPI